MDMYDFSGHLMDGAFGSVYSAIRRADGLPVAVKVVRNSSASYLTNESGETILAEAHFLWVVSGIEGCIGFVDVHQVGDRHLLVMERPLRSSDLFQVLEKVGNIPKERCRCFFRQIVDACVGCLKRNVVHGDLKMENVIVDLDTDRIGFRFRQIRRRPTDRQRFRNHRSLPSSGDAETSIHIIDDAELLSLLDRMLAVDWRKRPSLKQVSDHPWTNKLTANGEYVQ
ncbi:serine/threonine-protein kinase pim-3-like [Anneissia japonica]|uniref:serine/threonine-protein kinase pim-3-like n=1 Tax=Anneissia japonica TaxID=1529436 RepID=UPI001425716C|nr:serine/threonine-protein kinase pim-3-like [Anneissia japonica]